ncbi:MAG: hypothetical protein JSW48_11225 [Betaproteobacteria bacterium]|nr:MAG: hypothetical protein JSW48_11225 [Betaproteobacteria bacterium]
MFHLIVTILCLVTTLYASPVSVLATVAVGTDSVFVFASHQTASDIMTAADEYTSRMSQFDRMLRLKTGSTVSQSQYLAHMARNTLDWTKADQNRLRPLLLRLANALNGYDLPLPPTVLLIKTTGQEELGEGHTRGNAIVLPSHSLAKDDNTLLFLLAHELFHVMSRYDARFRRQAYALVGYRIGPELRLPAAIAPLQITNPDAPRHDSFIDVFVDGQPVAVVPVLLSRSAVFDPEIGERLDDYWMLRFLAVEEAPAGGAPTPQLRNGAPLLLGLRQIRGLTEQIGRNTRYVIHAEEVLAENFAFLVTGETVAEPQRVEALRRLLADPDGSANIQTLVN